MRVLILRVLYGAAVFVIEGDYWGALEFFDVFFALRAGLRSSPSPKLSCLTKTAFIKPIQLSHYAEKRLWCVLQKGCTTLDNLVWAHFDDLRLWQGQGGTWLCTGLFLW